MASAYSLSVAALHTRALRHTCQAKPASSDRRRFIVLTSGLATGFATRQLAAEAEDIGFFGIRKKVKEVPKKTEEKEAAEKEGEVADKREETAQDEMNKSDGFGAVVQAGAVAGAEVIGVFVATSVVKRILES